MIIDLDVLRPPPAGFAACGSCVYQKTGTAELCFTCSSEGPVVDRPACAVCGQLLGQDGRCPSAVCNLDDHFYSRIYTVTERAEQMWLAIYRYKYEGERWRAAVLGRILIGYLEANRDVLQGYDLITSGAIYVGPQAVRLWDYLRVILDAARRVGPDWPFTPGLIAKSGPTGRFLGISPEARREIAEGDLRAKLSVPEPEQVVGRRVLVFDDVYSEGYSLREMARVLLGAGAAEVAGLVLARVKGG